MDQFKFNKNTDSLFEAIISLKNTKEAEKFFRDLCTIEEITAMSERLAIAKMLDKGVSYRKIAEKIGTSTTTVSRVSQWLNNGEGGYRLVLNKSILHHDSSKSYRKS